MKLFNAIMETANNVAANIVPQQASIITPETPKSNSTSIMNDHDSYEPVNVIDLKNITQEYQGVKVKYEVEEKGLFSNKLKTKTKYKRVDKVVFNDFSLEVKDVTGRGQFISFLGKSGCGKSTLLRYISGLQTPTTGEILLYGNKKKDTDNIPMVFQQYSSFPWMTVLENVALPLVLRGMSKRRAYEQAYEMLKIVELDSHAQKWAQSPGLSGGQLQRVAIARNLIANPQILLMDEPFNALDIVTRNRMQEFLINIFTTAKVDPTILFVTHEISEAVFLSDTIVIMDSDPGRIHTQIKINFPYPRELKLKETPKFTEYVNEVHNIMTSLDKTKK
jgi:NitT/TauT family transport system ATP-binding protein